MAKIFCVANQKGGVGKTTTTVNLAAGLAFVGQRVLMVDLDPQGNATMGSGIDKRQLKHTVYNVLLEEATISQSRVKTHWGDGATQRNMATFDVIGANRDLAGAEVELVDLDRRENRLRDALLLVQNDYDFVLIDCPPSLSMLTLNGLCAAHGVVVPMQCERGGGAHAVRIFRARRVDRLGQHHQAGTREFEQRPQDHWFAARDVRSAHHPTSAGE